MTAVRPRDGGGGPVRAMEASLGYRCHYARTWAFDILPVLARYRALQFIRDAKAEWRRMSARLREEASAWMEFFDG